MRKLLAVGIVLAAAGAARADAPALLPVQGVLTEADGTPVAGDADLRFALYASALGGTALWSETQTVLVEDGLFTVYLGTLEPLDLALFRDHDALFLGVAVDAEPELDRFEIGSTGFAAFAQYAGTAAHADDAATLGGHDASHFAAAGAPVDWTDLRGVPAGLADGTDDDTLAGVSGCAGGQVLAWSGTAWGCADDADSDTTYTAGLGLTLAGTQFSAHRTTIEGWARGVCYDTEAELTAVLDDNYRGAAWVPAWGEITGVPAGFADGVDNDTTYSWATLPGIPAGFADGVDDNTTYAAGAGLTLTGTTFAVSGVTSAMIADGTIAGADIANDTISAANIAGGAVGTSEIANGSVIASHLSDGTALAEITDDDGAGSGLDADLLDGVHLASTRSGIEYVAGGSWTSTPSQLLRISGAITAPADGYVLVLAQGEKFGEPGQTWTGYIHWNGSEHNADFDAVTGWSVWSLQNVFPAAAGATYTFGVTDMMNGGDGTMTVYCSSLAAVFFPVRL